MKGVEAIITILHESMMSGRKLQDTENERLRAAYLTPAWGPTNIAFDAFVMEQFNASLAVDTAELDSKWPRTDRFEVGAKRMLKTYLPELDTWLKQQRADVPAAVEANEENDSDDGADENAWEAVLPTSNLHISISTRDFFFVNCTATYTL